MRRLTALAAVLLVGCYSPVTVAPVVAVHRGLTITILNPFDCTETTPMRCYERSMLEHECRCVVPRARP